MLKLAIVGAGPSGLFLTKNILKQFKDQIRIDLFEKLPTPLGLLNFGVAPDHPEVKEKFLHHFDAVFDSNKVQTFLNVDVGNDIQISELSTNYDAVALCTGMSNSNRNWFQVTGCYGADEIFGWYNGNPLAVSFHQDLSKTERLVIIGNGNVALDMARFFSKKPSHFTKGMFNNDVMKALEISKIREITILGRRELINASFTPAEFREFTIFKEYCNINVEPKIETEYINQNLSKIQVKNLNIMRDLVKNSNKKSAEKTINFKFSSPVEDVFLKNNEKIIKIQKIDKHFENIGFDLLIECTGFYQKQKFNGLVQDPRGMFITSDQYKLYKNVYSCGWSRTGPKGNVADSILEASNCARQLFDDLNSKLPK